MKIKKNFGDLPKEYCNYKRAKIVIVPVPYDKTSTWGKGADKGPGAIIEASANMELYDIETNSCVCEKGIFTDKFMPVKNLPPEKMVDLVYKRVTYHIKNKKFVVVIGGEHSVSIGTAKAHTEHYGKISVLQLDAHSDLRDEYLGSKYNHACTAARIKDFASLVQVGIRSMASEEKKNMRIENVFFAKDIYDNNRWFNSCVRKLDENVYITIDLDAFDPSIMPSTGTPEPGGLEWYQTISFLRKVFRERNVVGFDICELAPRKNNHAADFLAAKLIYTLLSYKFTPKR